MHDGPPPSRGLGGHRDAPASWLILLLGSEYVKAMSPSTLSPRSKPLHAKVKICACAEKRDRRLDRFLWLTAMGLLVLGMGWATVLLEVEFSSYDELHLRSPSAREKSFGDDVIRNAVSPADRLTCPIDKKPRRE